MNASIELIEADEWCQLTAIQMCLFPQIIWETLIHYRGIEASVIREVRTEKNCSRDIRRNHERAVPGKQVNNLNRWPWQTGEHLNKVYLAEWRALYKWGRK